MNLVIPFFGMIEIDTDDLCYETISTTKSLTQISIWNLIQVSNGKRVPGCCSVYVGDEKLPTYAGFPSLNNQDFKGKYPAGALGFKLSAHQK